MESSNLLLAIPSVVCVGILIICIIALLVAPPRFIRTSFLVMFVTVMSYMAVLIITMAGSFNPTVSDTSSTTATQDTDSSAEPAPTAPPSDGTSDTY